MGRLPTVATAALLELEARGLSRREIAAAIGLSRQAVGARLRPRLRVATAPVGPSRWYPRPIGPPPSRCAPCGRRVGLRSAKLGPCGLLPEPSCCAFCSRPLTAEALARAPVEGYIALVRTVARESALTHGNALAEEAV